ncbi:DUF3995 domain-containing protein [Actinocorallia libanotica]|uniref:DUF3995 domain-containing protein n=1 Tax=Actinocorallia libanotica TaxID=46162 RepID=A0ABP4BXY5_9ACTN
MSRADRARVGAYGAAVCAAAYGSMKLSQALGANALADKDPLPPHLREMLLDRHPLFVASHWLLACAAAVGVVVALASVRPWGARFPRLPLRVIAWTLGVFMIVRAVGTWESGLVGDSLLLAGLRDAPAEHTELAFMLARWDLLLWSPFFLVWGICWAMTGRRLGRRDPADGGHGPATIEHNPTTVGHDPTAVGQGPADDGQGPNSNERDPAVVGQCPNSDGHGPEADERDPDTDGCGPADDGHVMGDGDGHGPGGGGFAGAR